MIDWDKLRVFHAVAEAGSFTHAGDTLNLSQSAVSRQISALEEALQVPLFHRHARGLILTEQGEALNRTVREVFAKLAITEAFRVVEAPSGETFFSGDTLNGILASMEPKNPSIWKIVAGGTLAAGGEHLPDIGNLFRHCEATAGTSQFGLPRLPDDHLPGILPRAALDRFWPGARLLLALAEPLSWPLHMAHAAQKLMLAMKGSIAPDLAVRIVMEAAVPMSRVDPTTVPNN